MKIIALSYLVFVCLISVVTFLFYGWDKRQARKDGWRTPESKLHGLAFAGGWPGAMLGQNYFRHKTQKFSFKIMTWVAAAVHLAGFSSFLYFWIT
ncbi:MAG: uncharacterized membrane protein YsdA (DUF1294 family) [Mariniblastus sp.]